LADLDSYRLFIKQGETYNERFQWCHEDSTPYDITGYTCRGQIRNGAQNQGVLINIAITIIDALSGIFDVDIMSSDSKTIPATGSNYSEIEIYAYDIEFTSPGGEVYRVLQGVVEISPEVTK
jgi:hypothetical protein